MNDESTEEGRALAKRRSGALQERELIYEKLPQDIAERHVLLMVRRHPCIRFSLHPGVC